MNTLLKSVFIVVLFCTIVFSNGFEVDYQSTPWNGTGKKNFTIQNTTNSSWILEGIRFSIQNISLPEIEPHSPLYLFKNVNGIDAVTRYEIRINKDNLLINPGSTKTFSITNTKASSNEWTPTNTQFLLKTGLISSVENIKTIPGITLSQLDSISKTVDFYNENLFILDTLGINSPNWGSGFIDTWYDYKKDLPIWQIQVAIPSDTFAIWNEAKKFDPYRMDERDLTYGAGPLFLMATALVQEFLNIDMQLLLGISFYESNAGLSHYTSKWIGGYLDSTTGEWIDGHNELTFSNVKYTNHKMNGGMMCGPMHFIEPSYKDYVFESYRVFFPYDLAYNSSDKYLTTPQTGGCELNSPQIVNAYFLSSVYTLSLWQRLLEQLNEKALNLFSTSGNKKLAAQLISWVWNQGLNGTLTYCSNPDPNKNIINDIDYVGKVWTGINELEDASKKSITNNGTEKIYDAEITLVELERLLFGEGGNPSMGTLGTAGILHHFYHSAVHRAMLWNEVVEAFNLLKGKAPSILGKEAISYRYDYLAILRIIKKHLNLFTIIPNNETSYTIIEDNYPILIKEDTQIKNNDSIEINCNVKEDAYLDINSASSVMWTLDSNWTRWESASFISGDTLNAKYQIKFSKNIVSQYADITSKKSISLWVKVTDRNYNSTIDTVTLQSDPVKSDISMSKKSNTKTILISGKTIQISEDIVKNADAKLEIFSLDGKKLYKSKLDENVKHVATNSFKLSNGLYLLKISANNYSKSIKFHILR